MLIENGDLYSRKTSAFGISLPTALALESIFLPRTEVYDPERIIPTHIEISEYDEIWINLSTLFRNMVGSMAKEAIVHTTEQEFKDAIMTEIEIIDSLFNVEGHGLCKPHYYHCTYKSLPHQLPKQVELRTDKTDGQKIYRYKCDKVMELLDKETDSIYKFDTDIKPSKRSKAIIITHIPYDLLSYKHFSKLDLLESNTGRLKHKHQWNTKFYPVGDSDLSILPFDKRMLFVFGDRVQIHPSDIKLRRLILDIAKKRQWNAMTQKDKMNLDFELEIKEPYVLEYLKSIR